MKEVQAYHSYQLMSSILAHPNYTQEQQITQNLIMKAGVSRMSHAHD